VGEKEAEGQASNSVKLNVGAKRSEKVVTHARHFRRKEMKVTFDLTKGYLFGNDPWDQKEQGHNKKGWEEK